MKQFEAFIKEGVVKKQAPDLSRVTSLKNDARKSYTFLQKIIKTFRISDENANIIIKTSYDIIMDLIRARMLEQGFNASGRGAHEAEVAYLRKLGIKESIIQFADQLRYFRNRIMYYGKEFDSEYAEKVFLFLKNIYEKLK